MSFTRLFTLNASCYFLDFSSCHSQLFYIEQDMCACVCVYETRMPPAATKSKYGKNLSVLHFDPAQPQVHVACDVNEV